MGTEKALSLTRLKDTFFGLELSVIIWRDRNASYFWEEEEYRLVGTLQSAYHLTYEVLCMKEERNRECFRDYPPLFEKEILFDTLQMAELITDIINCCDLHEIRKWRKVKKKEVRTIRELYQLKELMMKLYMLEECYSETINSKDIRFLKE
jgi:hypothetical protein